MTGSISALLAEIDRDGLLGGTGLKSLEHFATWQIGVAPGRARNLASIARRRDDLTRCTAMLDAGQLSEDQVATIARRAPEGTDEHYANLATEATVTQLRTALRAAPKPDAAPDEPVSPEPDRTASRHWDDEDRWCLRAQLPKLEGATVDAALQSHLDALVAEWRRDHAPAGDGAGTAPPFPTLVDAFVRLAEYGWDAEVAQRPHGHRTTIIVHLEADTGHAALALGPALSEAERRYLACDARFETWFERDGVPFGLGRSTREIPRRIRRALERRDRTCRIPGCDSTRGLHAHHIIHWEDHGPTELWNLVLVCPYHHRQHHQGLLGIAGPADQLTVTDKWGKTLTGATLARAPTTSPPTVQPYPHPSGEHADWKWYQPPALV